MRLALAVILASAGCLQPSLIECGDVLCNEDAICLDHARCVDPSQLGTCITDGASCLSNVGDGVCAAGICEVVRCGNGTIELGELCDDGNRVSGDGCREDCRSDESCGNGILDTGERCDCGTSEATRPSYCKQTNDAAETAECDPACTRSCGDGVVTGLEQCDGANIPRTCADLGFYDGALACTPICSLDASACSGRCGDGTLQRNDGELCDGAAPAGDTCVDYGFDTGVLGCSTSCGPDLAGTCERYGWEKLMDSPSDDEPRSAAANDDGVIAVMYSSGDIQGIWHEVPFTRAGTYTLATASSTQLGAIGPTEVALYDGTSWTTTARSEEPLGARMLPTGQLFVLAASCAVATYGPGAPAIGAVPGTTCTWLHVVSASEIYVAVDNGVARWDGSAWSSVPMPTEVGNVFRVAKVNGRLVVTGDQGEWYVDTLEQLSWQSTYNMASNGTTAIFVFDEYNAMLIDDVLVTQHTTGVDQDAGMINSYTISPSGDFIGTAGGLGGGVWRMRPMWSRALAGALQYVAQLVIDSHGKLWQCGHTDNGVSIIGITEVLGNRAVDFDTGCYSMVIGSDDTMLASDGSSVFHYTGTTWETESPGTRLTGDPAVATFAIVGNGIQRRSPAGTWTDTVSPDCQWFDLAAANATTAYAVGYCVNQLFQIYRYDGTGWTVLRTVDRFGQLYAAPTGELFTVLDYMAVRYDGTWTNLGPITADRVTGTSATDVWFAGDAKVRTGVDAVWRWTGTNLAPERLSPESTGFAKVIAVSPRLLVTYRSGGGLNAFVRDP